MIPALMLLRTREYGMSPYAAVLCGRCGYRLTVQSRDAMLPPSDRKLRMSMNRG
jgi:hypothetical protein